VIIIKKQIEVLEKQKKEIQQKIDTLKKQMEQINDANQYKMF
jgi:prefoldin subunit 5